jgi:5-methylcytosine-specific restriction endonuclease McrA
MPADQFYRSTEWFKLRARLTAQWKRTGLPCNFCRQPLDWLTPKAVHVDHIRPRRKHPELALDIRNLQCLCQRCHNSTKQAIESRDHIPTIGPDGWPV